jgi:hypothetical protein
MLRPLDDIIKTLSGWPDYSFDPSAGLPSIEPPLRLPDDLHAYYSKHGEGRLFGKHSPTFRIVAPNDLQQVHYAVLGEWVEDSPPESSMYALIDCNDSNYVAIDLSPERCGWMYDVFHETVGDVKRYPIIAKSFTEFMNGMVNGNGRSYWLSPFFQNYGYAVDPDRRSAAE